MVGYDVALSCTGSVVPLQLAYLMAF